MWRQKKTYSLTYRTRAQPRAPRASLALLKKASGAKGRSGVGPRCSAIFNLSDLQLLYREEIHGDITSFGCLRPFHNFDAFDLRSREKRVAAGDG